jgi:hypothetical protein
MDKTVRPGMHGHLSDLQRQSIRMEGATRTGSALAWTIALGAGLTMAPAHGVQEIRAIEGWVWVVRREDVRGVDE